MGPQHSIHLLGWTITWERTDWRGGRLILEWWPPSEDDEWQTHHVLMHAGALRVGIAVNAHQDMTPERRRSAAPPERR